MLRASSKALRYEYCTQTDDVVKETTFDLFGNVSGADNDRPDHGGRQHFLPAFSSHV